MKLYNPSEAAKKLGITVPMLAYWRRHGRIEGIDAGNTTMYTEEQIAAADLTRKKPGPKRREVRDGEENSEPPMLATIA